MIGVFDSGIGGLTVVKEIFQQLPDYPVVYFGDTARAPYGSKSDQTIRHYAIEDANFLIRRGASMIVIACNSASAMAADFLKKELTVPVFEVITPAVTAAARASEHKRIGVVGTRATINSRVYQQSLRRLDPDFHVFTEAAPLLVPLVEENWLKRPETMMILKRYLLPLKQAQVDTVVLGCTHYPLLEEAVKRKMGANVRVINPAHETAAQLKKWLGENPKEAAAAKERPVIRPDKDGQHFYVSDVTPHFQNVAEKLLGRRIKLELADVEG